MFGFTDIDHNEFSTFVSNKTDCFDNNFNRNISNNKLKAFMKLVLVLEKKIMVRRFDFWLPLRRLDLSKRH